MSANEALPSRRLLKTVAAGALSVAYGLMFGTIILLIVLPSEFLALNKLRYWAAKLTGKSNVTYENVEPAYKEVYGD